MITRKTFVSIMEALQKSQEKASKIDEAINTAIEGRNTVNGNICFEEMFCDWDLQESILEALSKELGDVQDMYGGTWISWWVYELNWGKDWKPGCATDKDGNDIKVRDAGELYDFLTNNLTQEELVELLKKCEQ